MIIIRPTASLAKRMKVKLTPSEGTSSTRLGDWYAMDIVIGRQQYILCTSEKSRLAVVTPAAPYTTFPARLPIALGNVLRSIGISEEDIGRELGEMRSVTLAKTTSRSILGSMNDFRNMLEASYGSGHLNYMNPHELSLYLAETISLVLSEKVPKEAAAKIFGVAPKSFPISRIHRNAIARLKNSGP
jgi:hypothetical protein